MISYASPGWFRQSKGEDVPEPESEAEEEEEEQEEKKEKARRGRPPRCSVSALRQCTSASQLFWEETAASMGNGAAPHPTCPDLCRRSPPAASARRRTRRRRGCCAMCFYPPCEGPDSLAVSKRLIRRFPRALSAGG